MHQLLSKKAVIHAGSVDFASVAANTSATQTITVPGAAPDQTVMGIDLPVEGLAVGPPWVSAKDTVSVVLTNTTAAPVNPPATAFRICLCKMFN